MTVEATLVENLADKSTRVEAMRGLLGAVNARELRDIQVKPCALDALIAGLRHPDPRIRFWSVQLLDHCSDPRAIEAVVPVLEDPVPRVRRNAVHALGCVLCKPAWDGHLRSGVLNRMQAMAFDDPHARVRAAAARALHCRTSRQRHPSE